MFSRHEIGNVSGTQADESPPPLLSPMNREFWWPSTCKRDPKNRIMFYSLLHVSSCVHQSCIKVHVHVHVHVHVLSSSCTSCTSHLHSG